MPISRSSPLASEEPSTWSLVSSAAIGTAIALALALGVVISHDVQEDGPRAQAGDLVVPPAEPDRLPDAGTVTLPWNRMSVAVGEPEGNLLETFADQSLVAPPEGGSFVQVDLHPLPVEDGGAPFVSEGRPWSAEAKVVLTADGEDHPIDGPDGLGVSAGSPGPTGSTSRFVAVDGRPTDLEVTLEVDGQKQTVDSDGDVSRGRAAELLDLPTNQELRGRVASSCGTLERSGSSAVEVPPTDEPACNLVGSVRTPFVDGLGWAPRGREYLVVQAAPETSVDVTGDDDDDGWTTRTRVSGRLGGDRPVSTSTNTEGAALGNAPRTPVHQFVFEVPTDGPVDDLALRLEVDALREDPFTSDDPERLRLEWTVPSGVIS